MSGATFSRVKNWAAEILTNTDLNAEIDNILNNLGPQGAGAYSDTAVMMRLNTDPGEVGTESLATSLAGELERLRFAIKEIKGTGAAQWYSSPTATLTDFLNAIGGSLVQNRIVSGALSTNSSAPRYLVPAGNGTSITIDGSPTNFVYVVNGTQYSITTDLAVSGLSTAAATNNTAGILDSSLVGQESSKWQGEDGTVLSITTAGTGITALVGQYAAFKLVHGGNTEYFIAYVNSSTQLTNCLRGCFFDSSLTPSQRTVVSSGDTITLMKLTWLFANTAGAVIPSYINPSIGFTNPSDTTSYWYDTANNSWKTYNGAAWVTASSTLIGFCAQNNTACMVARSMNFFGNYDVFSNVQVDYVNATQVIARNYGSKLGVGTSLIDFKMTKPIWDITQNLESGYTESASTTYFVYVGESGQLKLSPNKPYFSQDIGRGWYHPYENWRAIAKIQNDASSNFDPNSIFNYLNDPNSDQAVIDPNDLRNIGFVVSCASNALQVTLTAADGSPLSPGNPALVSFRSSNLTVGTTVQRRLTSSISITAPVGATLGMVSNMDQFVWIHLVDQASGVTDIGLVAQNPTVDHTIINSSTMSSTATAKGTIYTSVTAASSRASRLVGRLTVNEANAGTYATGPSVVVVRPTLQINMTDFTNNTYNFSPATAAFGAVSLSQTISRRVGDSMEVHLYWQNGATGASSAYVGLPLPADPSKVPGGGRFHSYGTWLANNGGAGVITYAAGNLIGGLTLQTADTTNLFLCQDGVNAVMRPMQGNVMGGSSQAMTLVFTYPVNGWSTYGP